MPDPIPHYGIPRGETPRGIMAPGSRRRTMYDPHVNEEVPVYQLPPEEMVPHLVMSVSAGGADWGVEKLNVVEAWKVTKGRGVKVAVLDTGGDRNHPDFGGVADGDFRSFVQGESADDGNGHGTHCMGRVLARGDQYGVAPDAVPMFGKVLSNAGSGAVTWIAAGIRWAIQNGADVISMSLGGNARDSYIPAALAEAEAAGVIVIAAAGNDGPGSNTVDYPGGYPESVCTGASDPSDAVATFSSRGPQLFVAAPGVNIRSQYPGNRYATMSGTSMATPHVAGLAALWVASHPEIPKTQRPAKFREALKAACKDLGAPGRDPNSGWGLPDAAKLVGTAPVPPVPPVVPPVTPPTGWTGSIIVENGLIKSIGTKS